MLCLLDDMRLKFIADNFNSYHAQTPKCFNSFNIYSFSHSLHDDKNLLIFYTYKLQWSFVLHFKNINIIDDAIGERDRDGKSMQRISSPLQYLELCKAAFLREEKFLFQVKYKQRRRRAERVDSWNILVHIFLITCRQHSREGRFYRNVSPIENQEVMCRFVAVRNDYFT